MSNPAKDIRKQLRNVVLALLPEVLTRELEEALYKKLLSDMNARMDLIANNAKETLEKIDQRSRDVQSYVVRQNSQPFIKTE